MATKVPSKAGHDCAAVGWPLTPKTLVRLGTTSVNLPPRGCISAGGAAPPASGHSLRKTAKTCAQMTQCGVQSGTHNRGDRPRPRRCKRAGGAPRPVNLPPRPSVRALYLRRLTRLTREASSQCPGRPPGGRGPAGLLARRGARGRYERWSSTSSAAMRNPEARLAHELLAGASSGAALTAKKGLKS